MACNLDCITCFRNEWDKPLGKMNDATFAPVLEDLQDNGSETQCVYRGEGDPMFHPSTLDWLELTKKLGVKVELITNVTILKGKTSVI